MKILIENFWHLESGPVFTYGVAKGFKDNGIDTFVLTSNNIDNIEQYKSTFDSKHLFLWEGQPEKKHPFNYIMGLLKLKVKFKKIRFDYVLITFPSHRDLILANAISYKENIMILHDVIPHSSTDHNVATMADETVKHADNIMVLTKKYCSFVERKFNLNNKHVLYMRHGMMDYPLLNASPDDEYIKYDINYLYFGRIDGYKGLHVLSKAYKELQNEYSNISLTVAGRGDFTDYDNEYKSLNNVNIINKYLSDDEIAKIFTMPKVVLVLPYIDATQSGVIGTAFNYAIPVIASDIGGLKEQLFDGNVGLLVEAGSSNDLMEKMKIFLNNPEQYNYQQRLMQDGKMKMQWDYIVRKVINELENKGDAE